MERFLSFLERRTQRRLTKRRQMKLYEKSKPKTIGSEILSWIDALVFAIFWVIIINQYLFQLFVIPSPSMVDTLNVGDRVIVNKDSYGIELYPAGRKAATENRRVQRDEIITFYNPEYDSKGPVFDVLSQIVYMGTLTLVNIDRNDDGTPAERLYVKRAVGMGGDVADFSDGDLLIKLSGTDEFIDEASFREETGLADGPARTVDKTKYAGLKAAGELTAYQEKGIYDVPQHLITDYRSIAGTEYDWVFDRYALEKARTNAASYLNPSDMSLRSDRAHYDNGIYVPEGYVLPLGDNRDNSHDGRYFGPVMESRINGRVIGRFWPLSRVSSLMDNI